MESKIYLSKKEYENFLAEISRLENRLLSIKSNDYLENDLEVNIEGFNAKRREIKEELEELKNKTARIVVIDRELGSEDIIDINDYVTVKLYLEGEELEKLTFKLVGTRKPNFDQEIKEITIDSPMGKSVYQKKVGDEASYTVNKNNFQLVILSKTKTLDNDPKLTLENK